MTSTQSSVETKTPRTRVTGKHNDFFVPSLFAGEWKRAWPQGILYAIILFFALPVAVLLQVTNYAPSDYNNYSYLNLLERYLTDGNLFVTVYAALNGIFAAVVSFSYLFDRKKTNFVCSLPLKRRAVAITKSVSAVLWSVAAWLPNVLLLVIVTLGSEHIRPYCNTVMTGTLRMFLAWFCIFVFFYGLTALAVSLCGTRLMSVCMTGFFSLYVSAASFLVAGGIDMFIDHVNAYDMFTLDYYKKVSGVIRIFSYTMKEKGAGLLLCSLFLGLLYFAVSVLLITIRKAEQAETPFAFEPVRDVVKYMVSALAALGFGYLFYSIGNENYFWMLFGVFCGAVLAIMLCNTVFFKTPKMMFHAKAGMLILAASVMVFVSLIAFDVFGMSTHIPSAVTSQSVTIECGESTMTFTDTDDIAAINTIVSENVNVDFNDGYYKSVSFTWKNKLGLLFSRDCYMTEEEYSAFIKTVTEREDFPEIYLSDMRNALAKEAEDAEISCSIELMLLEYYSAQETVSAADLLRLTDTFEAEMRESGSDPMQRTRLGSVGFRCNGTYFTLPVFAGYDRTNAAIKALLNGRVAIGEYLSLHTVTKATLLCDGQEIRELDTDEVTKLLASDALTVDDWYVVPFVRLDSQYMIHVYYQMSVDFYEKMNAEDIYGDIYFNESETYLSFLEGAVPAEYLQ